MTRWNDDIWVEWLKPRHALKDIYISPESMIDINNWDIDIEKERKAMNAELIGRKPKTIVIVSGYFAPLGAHHIEFFEAAKKLGDELWVIVNNDKQLMLKKGFCIQDQEERSAIVSQLCMVDKTILSIDKNTTTLPETLAWIFHSYYVQWPIYEKSPIPYRFIFANGGDRTAPEADEAQICKTYKVPLTFGIGPKKTTSSSDLIERAGQWYVNHILGEKKAQP